MIQTTKGNIKSNSFYVLLWGWVVVFGNFGHYFLDQFTSYEYPYIIWLITIPAWIISMIHGFKKSKEARVKTYGENLVMWVWLSFLFSYLIIVFSGQFAGSITVLILIMAGMCTFITGLILKFKPLIYGGSSFWIFSALILAVDYSYAPLISGLATFIGYLIPGYLLKKA